LQDSVRQRHRMWRLSSLFFPHNLHFICSSNSSLYKWPLRDTWSGRSPMSILSLSLFIANRSLALLGWGHFISYLDQRQSLASEAQVPPLQQVFDDFSF